jgi:tetrapyrrole methylase family protein / MazG family protein
MIDVVGLGPGDLARVPPSTRELLSDHARTVIVRTLHHPAASQLAELRPVVSCDDIYEAADTFDQVYDAIADRVLAASDPIYAVPGSPMVGEFAVAKIRRRTPHVTVHPAESFLDAVFAHFGVDPLADGFQLLNGHELPSVLGFDVPTVIGHLDRPEILADLAARLDRALPEDAVVSLVCSLGAEDEVIVTASPERLDPALAGLRTSRVRSLHRRRGGRGDPHDAAAPTGVPVGPEPDASQPGASPSRGDGRTGRRHRRFEPRCA